MPEDDVSDLRDVVDAINKLCETMKTSYDEYQDCDHIAENFCVDSEFVDSKTVAVEDVKAHVAEYAEYWNDTDVFVSQEIVMVKPVSDQVAMCNETVVEPVILAPVVVTEPVIFETCKTDRLRDTVIESVSNQIVETEPQHEKNLRSLIENVNEPVISEPIFEKVKTYKSETKTDTTKYQKLVAANTDTELFRSIATERFEDIPSDVETVQCEPISEMYYTASSEVSLLSDVDFQERAPIEEFEKEKDDRTGVMTGHVAAMRERFESMTRTNTPCPDLMRSISPSLEVFRNISPDTLE